jgi:hypothetical protein
MTNYLEIARRARSAHRPPASPHTPPPRGPQDGAPAAMVETVRAPGDDYPPPPTPGTPEAIAWLRDLPRCHRPGCTLKRAAVLEWWPYCFEHAGDDSPGASNKEGRDR